MGLIWRLYNIAFLNIACKTDFKTGIKIISWKTEHRLKSYGSGDIFYPSFIIG
jgi:hypothetical protein